MKTIKIILVLILISLNYSCEDEVVNYDYDAYKFVSFVGKEVSVSETYTDDNKEDYPIYLRYDGSTLKEDFTVELKITEIVAKNGVDYITKKSTVTFKAGELSSEPFNITLINDLVNSPEDRSLKLEITSVSNPDIKIGIGVKSQLDKEMIFNILDDECPVVNSVFNSDSVNNSVDGTNLSVKGEVDNDIIKFTGDLLNYSSFSNAELAVTLNPIVAGAKKGSVTFADYDAGTDSSGYVYQFRQSGEGTFDLCSGKIEVDFDVYYESGGSWVFWYTSVNVFTVEII